ncbi:hypothetical protein [Sphingosinicella microcystinivorans]|uniref:Polyketide cyclase/dehydrase/lipid transport protein n=1 Tax=Sphingosinicella microcystinivorans TaxID=335406 RepID=A0AAD1FYZ7_SPHMI|nr:hypothetical protein [Sphingosinicella microcystinivorans]RKS88665.1 hypothetical protein DFR51_1866 [Sphingosinicella microcystinivorans]BBE32412.1 hypothetical protein SmB9_00700 [Sphingosinicella microcystinivorans]
MTLRKIVMGLSLVPAALLVAAWPAIADDTAPAVAPTQDAETILAPFSDHYEMRIEKPADVVWRHIKRLYVDGERMRQQGFAVSSVTNDPTAWLGAVRGVQDANTSRPNVTIMVSGIDEEARLLTLMIVLENPAPAYVIHQVRPDGAHASIYQTIIQTRWPVRKPEDGDLTPNYIRQKMQADVAFHNREVAAIMQREKAVIEALD